MIAASLEGLDARPIATAIVGSGPAGLALALELARRGLPSVVLESGLEAPGPAQQLSAAEIVDPRLHDGMDIAVSRRLGGTSNLWGGRCVPLDPIDFEPREFAQGARWPIGFGEIAPYYEAACRWATCGEPIFSAPAPDLGLPDGDFSLTRVERASNVPAFHKAHAAVLRASDLIDVRLGATLVDFPLGADGAVRRIRVAGLDGREVEIPVGRLVLAAGGLETTRLLLAKQREASYLFGGPEGPLGRHYMGHIIGEIADIVFRDGRWDAAFEFRQDGRGSFVRRRFTPSEALQRRKRLPNVSFWPVVPPIADARHRSGPLSAVALALSTPGLGARLLPEAIRKRHLDGEIDAWAHVANVARDLPDTIGFLSRFVHRRYLSSQRVSGYFVPNRAHRYGLSYSSEQSPRSESRVGLSRETDRLGLPRLRIDYRCHREDAEAIARAHDELAAWAARTGVGRVEYRRPEIAVAEAVVERMGHGTHQIGTARMGAHRREGVVDGDLRAFDCPNLFVLGSAVFPTSGQANPTLTIVALAARLADTLAHEGARPVEVTPAALRA